jgi:hypothetical protein
LLEGRPRRGRHARRQLALNYTEAFSGDANNDCQIDIPDFFAIDRGRAQRLTGWSNGDFDLSGGRPDAADYMLIDRAFLSPGQPLSTPTAGLVPEPTLFTLAAAGACSIALRPRRQRALPASPLPVS